MSTEHCQITCSPAGFTLIDNGSTNGCYVNDRKVAEARPRRQRHDHARQDQLQVQVDQLRPCRTGALIGAHRRRRGARARRDRRDRGKKAATPKAAEGLRRLPARDAAGVDEVSVLRLGAGRAARVHPRADGEPDAAARPRRSRRSARSPATPSCSPTRRSRASTPASARSTATTSSPTSARRTASTSTATRCRRRRSRPGDIIRVGNTEACSSASRPS